MIRRLLSWAVLLLLVAAWAVTLRPVALGGPATYVMVTGQSMEPTYHDGDFVVLRAQDDYAAGDIVTFPVPEGEPGAGSLVIHRIIGGTPEAFTLQGDNNDHIDDWTPSETDVLGSEWFVVPGGGDILRQVTEPTLLAALAGGIATMIVLMRPDRSSSTKPEDDEPMDPNDPSGIEPVREEVSVGG